MLLFSLLSLLTFAVIEVTAYARTGAIDYSEGAAAANVRTVEQGSKVVVKLDCPGCPFMRQGGRGEGYVSEIPSRPNSLVCLLVPNDHQDFMMLDGRWDMMTNGILEL